MSDFTGQASPPVGPGSAVRTAAAADPLRADAVQFLNWQSHLRQLRNEIVTVLDRNAIQALTAAFADGRPVTKADFTAAIVGVIQRRRRSDRSEPLPATLATAPPNDIACAIVDFFDSTDRGEGSARIDEVLANLLHERQGRNLGASRTLPYRKAKPVPVARRSGNDKLAVLMKGSGHAVAVHDTGTAELRIVKNGSARNPPVPIPFDDISALVHVAGKYNMFVLATATSIVSCPESGEPVCLERVSTEEPTTALMYSAEEDVLFIGTANGTIRTWSLLEVRRHATFLDAIGRRSWTSPLVLHGHSDAITSLCYVASDRLLCSSSMDLTIRLWDLSSGHQQRCFAGGHMRSINSIAFAPATRMLISGGADAAVSFWSLYSDKVIFKSHLHNASVQTIAIAPTRSAAVVSGDASGVVKVWDGVTYICLQTIALGLDLHGLLVTSTQIIVYHSGTDLVYLEQDGPCAADGDSDVIDAVDVNASDFALVGAIQTRLHFWNLLSGARIRVSHKDVSETGIKAIRIHRSGRRLMVGERNGTVTVLTYSTMTTAASLKGAPGDNLLIGWVDDCPARVVSISDRGVRVLDESTGQVLFSDMTGHRSWSSLSSMAFDGGRLAWATSSSSSTLSVFDARRLAIVSRVGDHAIDRSDDYLSVVSVVSATVMGDQVAVSYDNGQLIWYKCSSRGRSVPMATSPALGNATAITFNGTSSCFYLGYNDGAVRSASKDLTCRWESHGAGAASIRSLAVIEERLHVVVLNVAGMATILDDAGEVVGRLDNGGTEWRVAIVVEPRRRRTMLEADAIIQCCNNNEFPFEMCWDEVDETFVAARPHPNPVGVKRNKTVDLTKVGCQVKARRRAIPEAPAPRFKTASSRLLAAMEKCSSRRHLHDRDLARSCPYPGKKVIK